MLSDRRNLKAAAQDSLARAGYDPKKLMLIHTGAILLVSAVLMVVDYLLSKSIGATAGLGGLQTRAMLTTLQSVLQLVQTVALPFWQMGCLYAALRIARGETASPDSLLQGFRRFGSVLRLQLLNGAILLGLLIACGYAASFLFMMTSWGKEMMAQLSVLAESGIDLSDTEALETIIYSALTDYIVPVILIYCGLFLLVAVPIFFRMRFASYIIMDGEMRAMSAIRISRQITKGNCINLFKLDLSFWWFYALEVLLAAMCYGDLLLSILGVSLPWSSTVSYFMCFGLYAAGQLALHYACRSQVEVTYAHAYGALKSPIQVL